MKIPESDEMIGYAFAAMVLAIAIAIACGGIAFMLDVGFKL